MTQAKPLPPDEALILLINLERIRIKGNFLDECAWCNKPANGKEYPMPDHHLNPATGLEDGYYRACGRPHADRFYLKYTALENDVLRPWREMQEAQAVKARSPR